MRPIPRILITLLLVIPFYILSLNAQDWPQWRGINRDGKVTKFNAPDEWPTNLEPVWKVAVGNGDATPSLVGDRLYVFTRQEGKEVLLCMKAKTGEQIWQTEGYSAAEITGPAASHPGPRSTPTVSGNYVITVGVGGDIACFNTEKGELKWRNEEFKGQVPRFNTSMSPVVYKSSCIAYLGGPEKGAIIAFDLETGKTIWETEGEAPPYGSPVMMEVDGKKQVVFQAQTKIVGLDPDNGGILWNFDTPSGEGRVQNAASPVVNGQILYHTGLNHGFNAVEIMKEGNSYTTKNLWSNPEISTSFNTPVFKDGFLYAISNRGMLFCINALNGILTWSVEDPLQNLGSIVDAGKVMVALSGKSELVVFKPNGQEYEELVRIPVSVNPVYAHPVLSGNRIFVRDTESIMLYVVE